MENKKYTIKNISEKQLRLIEKSLDLYARLGLLQFERIVIDEISWNQNFSYSKNRDLIDQYVKQIRQLLVEGNDNYKDFTPSNWSLGIGSPDTPVNCQVCYEMQSDIGNFIAKKNNGNIRGKLDLTQEEDIIISDSDMRSEKIAKLLEKINNG